MQQVVNYTQQQYVNVDNPNINDLEQDIYYISVDLVCAQERDTTSSVNPHQRSAGNYYTEINRNLFPVLPTTTSNANDKRQSLL